MISAKFSNSAGRWRRREDEVEDAETEQPERGHRETHHRTAEEGDAERLALPLGVGRRGRARVRARGRLHADEAGRDRAQRAEDVGDGGRHADRQAQQDRDDDAKNREHRVLAAQERHRAVVDLLPEIDHDVSLPGGCFLT
jgi:hypothetical protein